MVFSDDKHFTIANIPFGVASRNVDQGRPQVSTRLHERIFFLPELVSAGLLPSLSIELQEAIQEVSWPVPALNYD